MNRPHRAQGFVPAGFQAPRERQGDGFKLEPLGPEHNERDYAAWTSSVDHIRRTPGFETGRWPHPMTPAENLADLERHARDFRERTGFTYTVLADGDVIGCVYIYPGPAPLSASVKSWVRATRAELDLPLHQLVSQWLTEAWPFENVEYASRGGQARS